MKTLVLKQTGYTVTGVADITMWGGGNGCIEMQSFKVDKINRDTLYLYCNLNDNGFGVEKINGAICYIYENYEGTLKFLKSTVVGKVSQNTKKYTIIN